MVVGGLGDVELLEHETNVRLDGLGAQEQRLADRRVGAALGHQPEHLALAFGEVVERIALSRAHHEAGDDRRIDHAVAVDDALEGIGEDGHVRHPVLEQVTDPFGDVGEERIAYVDSR